MIDCLFVCFAVCFFLWAIQIRGARLHIQVQQDAQFKGSRTRSSGLLLWKECIAQLVGHDQEARYSLFVASCDLLRMHAWSVCSDSIMRPSGEKKVLILVWPINTVESVVEALRIIQRTWAKLHIGKEREPTLHTDKRLHSQDRGKVGLQQHHPYIQIQILFLPYLVNILYLDLLCLEFGGGHKIKLSINRTQHNQK